MVRIYYFRELLSLSWVKFKFSLSFYKLRGEFGKWW